MSFNNRSDALIELFALRRKYGEIVRVRTWFGQFRELILKCCQKHQPPRRPLTTVNSRV